jgi:predicted secreted protein
MRLGLSGLALAALMLVACGGTSGDTQVSGTDPESIQSSPAGVATLQFLDLMALRPDMVASGTTLPAGITASTPGAGVTRYTFAGFTAANTGSISGTVDVTQSGNAFTEIIHLTVFPASGSSATWKWTYDGTQVVTTSGSTQATYSVSQPIVLVYTATAASPNPANDKTYTYTPEQTVTWTGSGALSVTLTGSYTVAQTLPAAEAKTIACTVSVPLVVTPTACRYPAAGTLNLAASAPSNSTATVSFGPACGQVDFNGASLALGGS